MTTATEGKIGNPYRLIWYRFDWTEKQIAINNTKYWKWEIKYNGFKCP